MDYDDTIDAFRAAHDAALNTEDVTHRDAALSNLSLGLLQLSECLARAFAETKRAVADLRDIVNRLARAS